MKPCTREGCTEPAIAQRHCKSHYAVARRQGDIALVLPRRTDELCTTCRTAERMHGASSYCRRCASDKAREIYRANSVAINARLRARRVPGQGRDAHLRKTYGITLADRERMVKEQGGVCAICRSGVGEDLHVDHCHETGKVRGMLCTSCNNGLGRFKDSVDSLRRAADYLAASRDLVTA